jgi:hypothetical protein
MPASFDGALVHTVGENRRLPLEPSPDWTPEKFLIMDARNEGPYMADVVCEFAEGETRMTIDLGLFPGVPTRLVLPLSYLSSQTVIPGRTPHRFKCVCHGGPVSPARLTSAALSARTPGGQAVVRLSEPVLTDTPPEEWPPARQPIADSLHQWAGRDWPGKSRSLTAVHGRISEELLSSDSSFFDELDGYGGWHDLQFEGTGFFRTEHDGRRWWLVDPDGLAFFSVGVDCVRPAVSVETCGNEDLFEELRPAGDGPDDLWSEGRDGRRTIFNALAHNLRRALGDQWVEPWMELCARRLRRWGFNTIGNWSDRAFCRSAEMPYVCQLNGFPTTDKPVFRDFPDVFSREYELGCRRFAGQLGEMADDRMLIGYFLRNEPHWAFGEYNLAERLLLQPEPFASRDRLVEWLVERYGSVGRLNEAWGSRFTAVEDLARGVVRAEALASDQAKADLREFSRMLIERYVRLPSEECKRTDPNHLNLGIRYAWIAHEDLLAGADAFDVFSINGYQERPQADVIARCARAANAPVIIGEFHTGALDRGLPFGGLRTVRTQQERGDSYRYYVEQGATLRDLVGVHYFQWNDQHVVGRYDGENWQIGIVDICQQPYEEFVAAARRTHARIYRVAVGQEEPFDRLPPAIPVI